MTIRCDWVVSHIHGMARGVVVPEYGGRPETKTNNAKGKQSMKAGGSKILALSGVLAAAGVTPAAAVKIGDDICIPTEIGTPSGRLESRSFAPQLTLRLVWQARAWLQFRIRGQRVVSGRTARGTADHHRSGGRGRCGGLGARASAFGGRNQQLQDLAGCADAGWVQVLRRGCEDSP
jgi:hypothetical protein